MTIAGNILQNIANPQVADVAGGVQQGMQAVQQSRLNQDRRTLLQEQAQQTSQQASQEQQRFTEVSDRNVLVEIANDINTALGMGAGEAQDKILKSAVAKAPEGSAPQVALNAAISAVGDRKLEILTNLNDRAMQQGFLQPTAKAAKTADQLERELTAGEERIDLEREKLEFQKGKTEGSQDLKQQQIEINKKKLDSKIKRLLDERDALPFGSPKRKFYTDSLNTLTKGKMKFSAEAIEANAKAVVDGGLSPASVSKRGGLQALVVERVRELNPNFNFIQADADAKYLQNAGNLQSRALIKGVQPLYDDLRKKGEDLNNTKIRMVNIVKNWFKKQTGDADVVAFDNLRDDVIAETERILLGSGVLSDSKYMTARANLETSASPEQIQASIDQYENVVAARLHALRDLPFGQRSLDSKHELAAEARIAQRALKARDEGKKKKRRATDNVDEKDPMGIL